MELDEYELHEYEIEHDHHAETDVDNRDGVELEDNLDGVGGMYDNFVDDDLYAIDSGELIGSIDFVNFSEEEVRRFNFVDDDIAFEFCQQYAKHHGFGVRHSRSEKCGEVRIRQEFVCHRQGYRSPKFYSIPNWQKRPRAETRWGCPTRMHVRMDDKSGHWYVTRINHPILELQFSSMLPCHRRMSKADIEQMNDMHKEGIGVSRIHDFMAILVGGYTDILRHYHRCLMFVRAKEVQADFECAKGDLVITTNLKQLEHYAAENYSRTIFDLFVPILNRACAMRVVDSKDNGSYFIHTVSRYGTLGKDWRVIAMSEMSEVQCTCIRMECFRDPCEHIIAVLVLTNVHEIPRSLILPRWTKDAKMVVVQSMGIILDSVQLTQH
ncbi:hypothetical protein Ahy_B10g102969 [Arachis hypogaea]|uniref:SWIM-type domain-containing protein n=1 Tax=Arachis hypogaea TaxID=3818 RepID=A0A444X2X2_ARAHY|nr:hypothetical protein Ahy_B10g102969 [Arachis hypogaea]